MSTVRLQALCDGVFAIAITLLVLEIPVPVGTEHLGEDLVGQWPNYAAYLVSFVTIGIIWINHHLLLDHVRSADRTLLWLNLLLLLFVALVPWPTAVAAEYLREEANNEAAAVLYGLVLFGMAASFALIRVYLLRADGLAHPDRRAEIRSGLRRSLVGPTAYATATLVGIVSGPVAFVAFAAIACYFVLGGRAREGGPLDDPAKEPA